ncbi:hypothetical protein JCM5350_005954 [Sporobolomyces pararoseus]
MISSVEPTQLEPKHSTEDDHPLVLPPSSSPSTPTSSSGAESNDGKGSSTLAALSRTLIATLAFLFKRPIRLFRPVKISTWAGIQAIAQEHGLKTVNRQFVRNLIKKEGWKFIPRHVLPPMVVNAMIGLTLFTSYTTSERLLLRHFTLPTVSSLEPLIEFVYIPFVSGSIAGAAQSILSTPLDNARLLLLRRQRYLRQTAEGSGRGEAVKKEKSRRGKGKFKARAGPGGGAGSGSLPFLSWYQLLRDSLFQSASIHTSNSSLPISNSSSSSTTSKNPKTIARERRIEQARQWARKGWSLFGLTLIKDSLGFGIFFATFEVGREASRRLGLWIDGITPTDSTALHSFEGEERDRAEYQTEEKKRRTFTGIVVQGFGILLSGGLAGYIFAGLGRPFERMRAAVWEGRARWSERDAKLALLEEAKRKKVLDAENGTNKTAKEKRRGKSIGGKSERRARKLLGAKKRKIGMVRIGQIRGVPPNAKNGNLLSARRLSRRKTKAAETVSKLRRAASSILSNRSRNQSLPHPSRTMPEPSRLNPGSKLARTPPPSAPSLIFSAFARYGPATFLLAPRSVLQSIDERLPQLSSTSAAQNSFPALSSSFRSTLTKTEKPKSVPNFKGRELDGPTRFIAKRRHLQELDKLRQSASGSGSTGGRGWSLVSKVFTFVPPYAVGFLVYALVQGDLKAEV